jgi:hypothetical protein
MKRSILLAFVLVGLQGVYHTYTDSMLFLLRRFHASSSSASAAAALQADAALLRLQLHQYVCAANQAPHKKHGREA